MKDKGFTLIELLAVIVILAIIALIATPIILNIINNTKEESNERSIELYAEAVKEAVARHQLNNNESVIGKFTTTDGSVLIKESTNLAVDYDGDVVCDTIELYSDGNIYLAGCKVNKGTKEYTYGVDQSYDNGQIVYFDVMNGKGCTEEEYNKSKSGTDYLNSSNGYNGIIIDTDNDGKDELGRNSCLKFYTFLDDYREAINLLLDHNTSEGLLWTELNSKEGPIGAINQLKTDTDGWKGTITPENYEYKGIARPYTIDYSEYKARLITGQEIAQITGADKALNWKEESSTVYYYLDGAKGTDPLWQTQVANSMNKSEYYWLFDRTDGCLANGCLNETVGQTYAYWTVSVSDSFYIWHVNSFGMISNFPNDCIFEGGVRPVIEVYKSKLSQQ